MKILAFELSSAQGSIALQAGGDLVFERQFPNDRKDSGAFFENVQLCLRQFDAPEQIVVGLGPGSYAGVRIAIATAVGLRTATGAKLSGIPSICALDVAAPAYCAIGDARRQSFFFATISNGRLSEGPILEPALELETRLTGATLPVYSSELLPKFSQARLAYPAAARLAELARLGKAEIDDAPFLEPIYLREPHITVPNELRSNLPMLG